MSIQPHYPLEHHYQSNRPLRTLLYLLDRRWPFYLWAATLYLIKQSPAWALPFLLARAINTLADPETYPLHGLWIYGLVTLILIAQNVPTHTYYIYLISRAVRRMEFRLRAALVTRLQQLSIAFHDRTESGRLQTKVLRDVEQIQILSMFAGEVGMMGVSSAVFAIVITAVRQPFLLLYFALMVPLCVALLHFFRSNMQERNREFRSEIENMSAQVSEMITMIPVARAHGVEMEAAERMEERFSEVNDRGVSLDRVNAIFGSCAWVTFQTSLVIGLGVMGWLCWKGLISVGDIALYQSMFSIIVNAVNMLLNAYPQFTKGMESIRSIGEILECPDLEHNAGKAPVSQVAGRVVFEDVGFHYANGRGHAVNGFSLDVRPGECIALVGPSGSGKSTVINLMIGFRRPVAGRILLDGADMETLDMRTFRRHISVVPQETMLASGTIRDNILYGVNEACEDRLNEAVEKANLQEFIRQLPDGLGTRIGEGGATLSGGQKQRVAIARALIRDPRILILDEATSALDAVSEKQVQEAIDSAIQNRTTCIVAHRLSTIRRADRIVVMQAGRIAELGSYDELMARRGLFFEMQQLQH
jgi:ATP-binding cassette subfamily B protein